MLFLITALFVGLCILIMQQIGNFMIFPIIFYLIWLQIISDIKNETSQSLD